MKTIVYVHQSADMYGSDRVLLNCVRQVRKAGVRPIVLLPVDGPLLSELRKEGIECYVVPIARLSRSMLSFRGILSIPFDILRSMYAISRVLKGRKVDLVHSNTLAVLSGGIWAKCRRVPHLWHVHEIILHPAWARKLFAFMLFLLADKVLCVSYAARNNLLKDCPRLEQKSYVVWNGMIPPDKKGGSINSDQYRRSLGVKEGEILVALVGRINRMKGQRLFVEAANLLFHQGVRNIRYLIVGSPPRGQEYFYDMLRKEVDSSPARELIVVCPFTRRIEEVWGACDIAVVPSTEPEAFGMVVLEAMAAKKPVIAANHGGVTEIVVDGKTGVLIEPNNVDALAHAILNLARNRSLALRMGLEGRKRFEKLFSLDRSVRKILEIYSDMIKSQS